MITSTYRSLESNEVIQSEGVERTLVIFDYYWSNTIHAPQGIT